MNNKAVKIAGILVGSVLSVVVLAMGFSIVQQNAGRAEDQVPRDVVAESTSSSANINWITGTKTQGVVEYGASQTALNLFAPETQSGTDHNVELTLLTSDTTYYFDISIGGKKYDNGGVPWTFSTKAPGDNSQETVRPTTAGRPTPVSTVVIRQPTGSCREVYCNDIKEKLGRGCTTQDYFRCIRKLTPTVSK